MCNMIHPDARSIKKKGVGWKIFKLDLNKELLPLVNQAWYKKNKTGWICWIDIGSVADVEGFCFFLQKREAERILKIWSRMFKHSMFKPTFKLCPIEYQDGLVRQNESAFLSGKTVKIALCRKFRVMKGG